MDNQSFREWAVAAAQWASDYRATLSDKPVRAQTPPGAAGGNAGDLRGL